MDVFRLAWRRLRRTPGFTLTVVLTIAVCLGANLAMFAVLDAIVLRPLPFPQPDRLVALREPDPVTGTDPGGVALSRYYDARGRMPGLAAIGLYRETNELVGEPDAALQEPALRVSPDFLATLGVGPALGRGFQEVETLSPLTQHAVILGDAYWREHFQADPAVLGRTLRVNGAPRTIVGILPPSFRFLSAEARLLLPLTSTPEQRAAGSAQPGVHMIGRLQPQATLAQVEAQFGAFRFSVPVNVSERTRPWQISLLHEQHVRAVRPMLYLMQGGALLLLLAGLVNVVSLLSLRAASQRQDAAIRRTLGAHHRHVWRQVLGETLLPVGLGGVLGLLVGAVGIGLLSAFGTDRLPLGATVTFDASLAFTGLLATGLIGLLLAIPVAAAHLHGPPERGLRAAARGSTGSAAVQRLRHGFVVVQIALAFVLLAGAALLGLSLDRVMALPPGFAQPEQVLAGRFTLPYASFPVESGQRLRVLERLAGLLAAQPGVTAVGTTTDLPLSGAPVVAESSATTGSSTAPRVSAAFGVSGDYFAALGIPLLEGRFLSGADARSDARTCVIDADLSRRQWPAGRALGQTQVYADTAGTQQACTVVGVVGAVRQTGLTEVTGRGAVYVPYAWHNGGAVFVVVRALWAPDSLAGALRAAVRQAAPELAVTDLRSMSTRLSDSLAARRAPALLAGLVATVALLLAAIGTFGVLSYALAQRRRELGIRQALGAQPSQLRRVFLGSGLKLVAGGLLLGVPGAWLGGRALEGLLYGVPAFHPASLLATASVLVAVAMLACLIPALRAARVPPMKALAAE